MHIKYICAYQICICIYIRILNIYIYIHVHESFDIKKHPYLLIPIKNYQYYLSNFSHYA